MASGHDPGTGYFSEGNTEGRKKRAFGVGNIEFLDSQNSRVRAYWRSIEFGTEVADPTFLGRPIAGAWAGPGGGRGRRHGQTLTPFERGATGQQFIPYGLNFPEDLEFSARRARQIMGRQGIPKIDRHARGKIKKEIEPHEVYAKAWAEMDVPARERDAIREVFGQIVRQAKTRKPPVLSDQVSGFVGVRVVTRSTGSLVLNDQTSGALGDFNQRLLALNKVLAEEFQKRAAENLVLVRPDTSTGLLRKAILDRRNRFPQ